MRSASRPWYLGANAHSLTMTELATAVSRSRGLNGRIAAEPEADSRARLGLFLETFMPSLDITVVSTALHRSREKVMKAMNENEKTRSRPRRPAR